MQNTFSRVAFVIILAIAAHFHAFAQKPFSLKGKVVDENSKPLANATVMLFVDGQTDSVKTTTNDNGIFLFKNVNPVKIGLAVTFIDYDAYARYYDFGNSTGDQNIADIKLTPGGKTLDVVTVQASQVQIKEDTVSYKIDSTMYRKNDNVEELLKKLPGVEVDTKTGAVTAQGQSVNKVKVNGKDFFGGDVTTATKNLNADMVDRIDIIDDYGDQAAFTGVKTGDASKTLNIQLKKDKNKGWFGNASLGGGTDGRYNNALTVNRFNNNRQISLIGNMNNTNASTFNFGNLGGMMGGMVRSIGGAFGNVSGGSGVSNTKSIGLNYRDQWGPKVSAYGSYSFTNKGTQTNQDVTQQNVFNAATVINNQYNTNYTLNNTHRITYNFEFKFNPSNYLKISPSVSLQQSTSNYLSVFNFANATGKMLNQGTTRDFTKSSANSFNGTALFNHRFDAKGRVISFNLQGGSSQNKGDDTYNNTTTYFLDSLGTKDSVLNQYIAQNNENYNYSISTSYIEPFTKQKSLEFNYSFDKQYTNVDRENFLVNNGFKTFLDTASTIYENIYYKNKFGVNFRNNQKKFNYTAGFAVQPATIESRPKTNGVAYTQHITNYFPTVRFAYNFSRSRSFNVNYNGRSNQPSYTQLQPVADYSNPQYIVIGNPNLRPEFSNTLSMRYNNFNFIRGDVFFGNVSYSFTQDKIVNNVTNKGIGVQETRFLNASGFYTANAFYAYSKPFQNRKYVFNYGGNAIFNNNISFLANAKNVGKNLILTQRLNTVITIKKWLETGGGVSYTFNKTDYSLRKQLNTKTTNWNLTHNSRIFLKKDVTLTYDVSQSIFSGYTGGFSTNPLIINGSLEKLLSQKYNASLKFNAYDILKQNTNINRTVTGNSITDTRTNNITRYFMLSLVFRFSKFVGNAPGGRGMGGPPPPPGT